MGYSNPSCKCAWLVAAAICGCKGHIILLSWYDEFKLPKHWRLSVSDNGWTTNEIGLDWIKHFELHTQPRKVGGYRLLILDGHDSHHLTEFELFCQDHNIITLCMPSHSSYILQPLDVGCFSPPKKAYGKQIEGLMRGGQMWGVAMDVCGRQWTSILLTRRRKLKREEKLSYYKYI